jgi:glycosyltransferase involved in cell wall biosynthesis
LYEAFAAGRPVIARRGVGEIGEILEEIPAGILIDPVNPTTVREAIDQLRQPEIYAKKQAAAYAARSEYNWAKAEQYLSEIYTSLLR